MKLKDYLEEIEQLKQKGLVYKELKEYLQKFLHSDTAEPELFIPIGSGVLDGGSLEYQKTVPEHIINEVLVEVEAAEEELDKDLKLKLEQTIGN